MKPTTVNSADLIPSINGASEEVGGDTITYAQRERNPISHAPEEPESTATNDQESALRHVILSVEPSYADGHHDTFSFLELSAHSGGQNASPSVVYSQEMSFPERSLDLQPSSTFTLVGSSGAVDGLSVKGATAGWEALPYSEDSAHNRQKAAGGHHAYLGIQYQNPWRSAPGTLTHIGSSLIFMSGAKVGEILRKHSPASQPTIHQLADFLEAWESEPGALQQLTTHQYDSTLLPDYDLALCYAEGLYRKPLSSRREKLTCD